jgi:hypothetical protein
MKPQKLTDLWQTPDDEIAFVRRVFGGTIDLDPCAATDGDVTIVEKDGEIKRIHSNVTRHAETNYDIKTDGLGAAWFGRVFVNPPYSQLLTWCEACHRWAERDGITVLAPVPATPATQWWQLWVARAKVICLCAKRIQFLDHEGRPGKNPRHDIAWVLWGADGQRLETFHDVCAEEKRGCVLYPYALPTHRAQQMDAFFGQPVPP